MRNVQDAVVVGGGPAGSCAAWKLSNRGVGVTVFEEHEAAGVPSHCAGHLSIRSLKNLGLYPLPKGILENEFSGANFYSPNGTEFSVHLNKPVTCAVNRELFDRFLMEKAKSAGAQYCLSSKVQSLQIHNGSVTGVSVVQGGRMEQFSSRIVVDAEGISSRLTREAGLPGLNREGLVYTVEAEVEGVRNVEGHAVEVYLGSEYAPGFYAWLIPKLDDTAKVGLAARTGNPKELLHRLMQKHPVASRKLQAAKVTRLSFHAITLGGPIAKTYSDGLLAVGDCASQVKPTTGGGVIFSLTCARIAAEVAAEAIKNGDCSAEFLQLYQKRCEDKLGFDVRVMLQARNFLNSLSDRKLDDALRFSKKVGLDKALRDVDEIDFQGRTLLSMLKRPAAYGALAYFLALYLAANP